MDLLSKIRNESESNNYGKTIELINKYVDSEDAKITPALLNIYAKCLIGLNKYEEALNMIEKINEQYPGFYKAVELAKRYIECGAYDKVDSLVPYVVTNEIYDIGAYLLSHKQYDKAKFYLQEYLNSTKDEPYYNNTIKQMATDYLNVLNSENFDATKLPIVYKKFIEDGNTLEPGHVIYTKKARDFNKNLVEANAPFMIWKKMDGCSYAFSLGVNKKENPRFIIDKNNYPGQVYDRRIKDVLVIIRDKYVQRIVCKLTEEDYKNAIEDVHLTLSITGNKLGQVFMNEYQTK